MYVCVFVCVLFDFRAFLHENRVLHSRLVQLLCLFVVSCAWHDLCMYRVESRKVVALNLARNAVPKRLFFSHRTEARQLRDNSTKQGKIYGQRNIALKLGNLGTTRQSKGKYTGQRNICP